MSKIVRIIRRCRIHSRVLLDNGQRELIPTANAVVGTFFYPHRELMSLIDPISQKKAPLAKGTNEKVETIHIFRDYDAVIEETDKNSFISKIAEKEKEGFVLVSTHTSYLLQQDPPIVLYYAKFRKKDNLS